MWKDLRASFLLLALLTAVTGFAYPGVVAAVAHLIFPWQAQGSLIERGGAVVGSALIGQEFTSAGYFWGRPSAAPKPYDAANSGASNLAPSSRTLAEAAEGRRTALTEAHSGQSAPIPADLLTASASGLDPHLSPAAVHWQVKRVANARRVSQDEIRKLVERFTEGRELGVLGEPRVNVLRLNLALDETWPMR